MTFTTFCYNLRTSVPYSLLAINFNSIKNIIIKNCRTRNEKLVNNVNKYNVTTEKKNMKKYNLIHITFTFLPINNYQTTNCY